MKKYYILLLVLLCLTAACIENEEVEDNNAQEIVYDFSNYEIPVKVIAPKGAMIKEGVGNGKVGNVRTINYELVASSYSLDVTYIKGTKYLKETLLETEKEYVQELEEFVEIVQEGANGFIFKLLNEEDYEYGFYYLLMKEGQAIEFSTGVSIYNNSFQQVEKMYNIAKSAR